MISAAIAEEIGWRGAVARLAYERTKAETCVNELKKYGGEAAIRTFVQRRVCGTANAASEGGATVMGSTFSRQFRP